MKSNTYTANKYNIVGWQHGIDYKSKKKCGDKGTIGKPCPDNKHR